MCADHLKNGISPKARTSNQPALYCRALILLRPPLYSHVLRSIGWKPTTQRTGTHNVALHLKAASRETKGPKHVPSWIRTRLARLRLPSRRPSIVSRDAQPMGQLLVHRASYCTALFNLVLYRIRWPQLLQRIASSRPKSAVDPQLPHLESARGLAASQGDIVWDWKRGGKGG